MDQAVFICITDIGSTTTKAVLFSNEDNSWNLLGVAVSPTTVEEPNCDVKIGVFEAIKKLESQTGIAILSHQASETQITLNSDAVYYSTSSAGGGLQILVIGLTLFDSAGSARRASLGAGGVILDTFAIDDKRSAIEQMLAMKSLYPDMILLSGGVEHGAISGVLRLAEVIRIANPQPKYETNEKIPLIFAGNSEADEIVQSLIGKSFDLHIVPNLRPDMQSENLQPTQDLIQQLFMENVMERAPGYRELKTSLATEIIPTPLGVMNSLTVLGSKLNTNLLAFDIGGATTDVFACLWGKVQRTVSANMGMSYSALNVLKESGITKLLGWLGNMDEEIVRNYLGNKTLNPTYTPQNRCEEAIEQALAREAIRNSYKQHQEMHYNTQKIGFLDKLSLGLKDKYEEQFSPKDPDLDFRFKISDIGLILGAGGIFAHCSSLQATMIIIDGYCPKGITEIAIDPHFITPHLGVLHLSEPEISEELLLKNCVKKLALHIAPLYKPRKQETSVMEVKLLTGGKSQELVVFPDEFHYFPAHPEGIRYEIKSSAHAFLQDEQIHSEGFTTLDLIIDTREHYGNHIANINRLLGFEQLDEACFVPSKAVLDIERGEHIRQLSLPYYGDILKSVGEIVFPMDIIASNKFNPPKLYVVNTLANFGNKTLHEYEPIYLIKIGDKIDIDDKMVQLHCLARECRSTKHHVFYSPVRGRVEYINTSVGIVVLSEIQDYADRPITYNIATKLGVKPQKIRKYLKKDLGDFVYRGDTLATRIVSSEDRSVPLFIRATDTGTITEIDDENGTIVMHFIQKPHNYLAHVKGKVVGLEEHQSITISHQGIAIYGILGIGNVRHGTLKYISEIAELQKTAIEDKVLYCPFDLDMHTLQMLAKENIAGLILPYISQKVLCDFLGYDLGIINTGSESINYPIVICEGFGAYRNSIYDRCFIEHRGASIYVEPHTRIRAGVVRPKVVIS